MQLKSVTDRIKELSAKAAQFSEGYKQLTKYANQLDNEIRQVKKDVAALSRAGLTTRYIAQYRAGLVEDAVNTRNRALFLREQLNSTFVSLYELKLLVSKSGIELVEDDEL